MGIRQLWLLACLLVALTFMFAFAWNFWLEDLLDPFLPGVHVTENFAERWESIIVSTALVAAVVTLMFVFGQRMLRDLDRRQQVESMAFEGFMNDVVAAFVADGERIVKAENARCQALLGPHFGSLVGRSFHDLLPIDLTDTRYLDLEIGLRDHGHWRGEFRATGNLGDVKLSVELSMQVNATGVATSLTGKIHDLEPVRLQEIPTARAALA